MSFSLLYHGIHSVAMRLRSQRHKLQNLAELDSVSTSIDYAQRPLSMGGRTHGIFLSNLRLRPGFARSRYFSRAGNLRCREAENQRSWTMGPHES